MSSTLTKTKPFHTLVDECTEFVAHSILYYDPYDSMISSAGQFRIRMKPIEDCEKNIFTKVLFDRTLRYYEQIIKYSESLYAQLKKIAEQSTTENQTSEYSQSLSVLQEEMKRICTDITDFRNRNDTSKQAKCIYYILADQSERYSVIFIDCLKLICDSCDQDDQTKPLNDF